MRPLPLIATFAAIALAAACSRADNQKASADLQNAGHTVGSAVQDVAHNRDVKNVEASFSKAGHVAAQDARKLAAGAKVQAHKLAADTGGAATTRARDALTQSQPWRVRIGARNGGGGLPCPGSLRRSALSP